MCCPFLGRYGRLLLGRGDRLAHQNASGGIDASTIGGYTLPERHQDLYKGMTYPKRPNMLPLEQVAADKPALKMMFETRAQPLSRDILAAMETVKDAIGVHTGGIVIGKHVVRTPQCRQFCAVKLQH